MQLNRDPRHNLPSNVATQAQVIKSSSEVDTPPRKPPQTWLD